MFFFRKSLNPSEHLPAWGKESTSPTPESTNQVYVYPYEHLPAYTQYRSTKTLILKSITVC